MSKGWLRAIAINELLGAVLIAAVWVGAMMGSYHLSAAYVITSIAFFGFSALAGTLLLRQQHTGIQLSRILQLLQIIGLTVYGVTLRLELGLKVTTEFNAYEFTTHWGFNGLVGIARTPGAQWSVTFNALALAAFIYLSRHRQRAVNHAPIGVVAA